MDHLGRPGGPPAQTRPCCALRGAGGRRRWPAARIWLSGRPSSPRAWSLMQPLPSSSASSTCEHRRRTRAGEKVAEADEFGGWRGVSRLWIGYSSTIPKEKLERQEIVEYPCGSLSPSLERDRPGGDAARLTPPAAGRRSTVMRGGLGREIGQWAGSCGEHGGLARAEALLGTGRTAGSSSGLR